MRRREFLAVAAGAAVAARGSAGLRLGVMDGVVGAASRPDSVELAQQAGLAGVQVTIGHTSTRGGLFLSDPELQQAFLEQARKRRVALDSTYLDILHVRCLKEDPKAREAVVKGIEITRRLKAGILMTVFFGKCSVLNRQELDSVADVFKELAPEAEKAGVVLGFENLLNAEDNARAIDRVGSKAFKIYYDVGNATNLVGVDAAKEIRFLGRERICQLHFKDKGYLGEGKVDFAAVLAALEAIGFRGWANLETEAPSGKAMADLQRNVEYLRKLSQG